MTSKNLPLAKSRLVATLPPAKFFGGNNLRRAQHQIAALRRLGAAVYEFDTTAVYLSDHTAIERQKDEIRSFNADAVVSTPNAGYVVQGGLIFENTSSRNLFLDDLELPAILFWDHALTQPASYLLTPQPAQPSESQAGAISVLRALFCDPRIEHYFPDSGHLRVLDRLGIASFDDTRWYVQEVGDAFNQTNQTLESIERYDEDVAFFGNLYLVTSKALPYSKDRRLIEVRSGAQTACSADWSLPAFQAYSDLIASLDADTKASCRLDPDQSFYWRFIHDELSRVMNAEHRMNVLQSCGHTVACYGNFNDPDSSNMLGDRCLMRKALPYDKTLADAFRNTRVVIDVANAAFINGFSVKPIVCFAAGGFVLTNFKADFVRAFGSIANEVIYSDASDLASKLDYFLLNDRRRRDVSREIQSIARNDYTTMSLFAKTIPRALSCLRK